MAKKEQSVPPDKCFWVHKGPVLKSLKELKTALGKMKKETFVHHVSESKNDFGKWVNDVIGNKKLGKSIKSAKSKSATIKLLKGV